MKLDVLHTFVVEPMEERRLESGAITIGYEYRLLDSQETELLVYHWHPDLIGRGPDFPPIHVSASVSAEFSATVSHRLPLDKRHIPTGLLTLSDIGRMLIAEFGVAERYRDWPRRLDRVEPVLRRSLPERA